MSSHGKTSDIVKKLPSMMPDAWPVFFRNRYPRSIQIESMPYILNGESVCICSPTASGKTEAVVAPLYQRHVSFRRNYLSVVYIAPTKALVNDLYFRLNDYLGVRIGKIISRYTGDHHDFKSPKGLFLLLTTPEALDSLQLMHAKKLINVCAVVVDEIHLLQGTPRGQQLRHVINRLRANIVTPRADKDNFHMIGMSATINQNENEVINKYWFNQEARFLESGEPRDIEMIFLSAPFEQKDEIPINSAEAISSWVQKNNPNKVLIFGNTRNFTHALAVALHNKLKGTRWPVHMHIGILTGPERVRVEDAMKNDMFGICAATSTLEVGIDIGDIDLIILAEVPYSINSFLQRIGRGNRKSDVCRVAVLFKSDQELMIFKALYNSAISGNLDDLHEYDRPSVQFQQVLSLAWRGVRMEKPLTLKNSIQLAGGVDHKEVINDMLTTGALKEIGKSLIPTDELMDEGDKRLIHTVILGSANRPIYDMESGEALAYTSGDAMDTGLMFIGGKMKRAVESANGDVYLEPAHNNKKKRLVRLPSSRGKRGLSRNLIWATSKLEEQNPKQWIRYGNYLITWGGFNFNKLIEIILKYAITAKNLRPDDIGIDGLNEQIQVDPEKVYKWAEKIRDSGKITFKDAYQFLNASRYLQSLSRDLQRIEAINSIPFPSFFRWLDECKRDVLIKKQSDNL